MEQAKINTQGQGTDGRLDASNIQAGRCCIMQLQGGWNANPWTAAVPAEVMLSYGFGNDLPNTKSDPAVAVHDISSQECACASVCTCFVCTHMCLCMRPQEFWKSEFHSTVRMHRELVRRADDISEVTGVLFNNAIFVQAVEIVSSELLDSTWATTRRLGFIMRTFCGKHASPSAKCAFLCSTGFIHFCSGSHSGTIVRPHHDVRNVIHAGSFRILHNDSGFPVTGGQLYAFRPGTDERIVCASLGGIGTNTWPPCHPHMTMLDHVLLQMCALAQVSVWLWRPGLGAATPWVAAWC